MFPSLLTLEQDGVINMTAMSVIVFNSTCSSVPLEIKRSSANQWFRILRLVTTSKGYGESSWLRLVRFVVRGCDYNAFHLVFNNSTVARQKFYETSKCVKRNLKSRNKLTAQHVQLNMNNHSTLRLPEVTMLFKIINYQNAIV